MKKLTLLLAFGLAAGALHAFAPHPSVLTVKYKDQMLPVVKVLDTDPVVLVDGQEKRIRTSPIYLLERSDAYGAGLVQVRRATLGNMEVKTVATQDEAQIGGSELFEGGRSGTSYFEAALCSKQTISKGFLAIVIFSPVTFTDAGKIDGRTEVIVHDLPVLPAGQEVVINITAAITNGLPRQRFFFQIFDDDGREVVTDHLDAAWQYYATRDRLQLKGVVARYTEKFQGADHAAVPAITPRPVFFGSLKPPAGPVTAVLAVSAEGLVTHVEVRGVEDAAVRKSISEALGGWQFLPQLKAGQPVASKIQVPLQF